MEKIFKCQCGSEVLIISHEDEYDDEAVAISILRQQREYSWKDKIFSIFKIIKTGMPYLDDIYITNNDFEKFKQFINNISVNTNGK